MKRALAVCLCLVHLAACTTAVAPQAEAIKTTRNPDDVKSCAVLGTVEARPPFTWPGDDVKQLKNKALPLGADTVFVTNQTGTIVGVAYRCAANSNIPPKQ